MYTSAYNLKRLSFPKDGKKREKNFNSTPDSATGQYDRLFEAIQTGNTEEVQAATKKLERMLAEGKIKELKTDDQLKARLKKYDEDILDAARAKNAGDMEARVDAKQEVYDRLCTAYGVKKLGEKGETDEDKAQRARFRELIDKAVNEKAEQLYKGGTEGSVYDTLTDALETGKRKDVQDEIDRLRTAGKADSQIKSKITDAVKEEYLAGNDHDREKLEKLKFLQSSPKRDALFWLIFTVPGTPKDLLCYFAGLTDLSWGKWLLLCTVGRLPSVLTSTIGGSALGVKDYQFAILVFAVTLAVSGVGLLIYRAVCRRHERKQQEHE